MDGGLGTGADCLFDPLAELAVLAVSGPEFPQPGECPLASPIDAVAAQPRVLGDLLFNRSMPGLVTSLSFSADGRTLASGSDGQGVTLWNPETLEPKGEIQLSGDSPRDVQVAFSPTGAALAVGTKNEKQGCLTLWEIGQR